MSRKEREWLEIVKVNLIAGWKLETKSMNWITDGN
jgi:hypothetical protein